MEIEKFFNGVGCFRIDDRGGRLNFYIVNSKDEVYERVEPESFLEIMENWTVWKGRDTDPIYKQMVGIANEEINKKERLKDEND